MTVYFENVFFSVCSFHMQTFFVVVHFKQIITKAILHSLRCHPWYIREMSLHHITTVVAPSLVRRTQPTAAAFLPVHSQPSLIRHRQMHLQDVTSLKPKKVCYCCDVINWLFGRFFPAVEGCL